MRTFRLERTMHLARPPEELFGFFSDPSNLEDVTPPWLRFRVLRSSTEEVRLGTEIDYALRLRGLPLRWRSRITAWDPPHGFVDEQVRGPYRVWVHRHALEPSWDGGTLSHDVVDYAPLVGGALVDRLLVRRDLDRIFAFRQERLRQLFGGEVRAEPVASEDRAGTKPLASQTH